jgi:transmembrane sensor
MMNDTDRLLEKLRKNNISREELYRLYSRLQDEGKMYLLDDIMQNKFEVAESMPIQSPGRINRVYHKIKKQLHEPRFSDKKEAISFSRNVKFPLRFAAAFLLVVAGGYYLYQVLQPIEKREVMIRPWKQYTNEAGSRKVLSLPDSTIVWLMGKSSLSVHSEFGKGCRGVRLTGQAFFKVKRDPSRPFVVETGNTTTTVLGTSFYIESVAGKFVKVSVASGKVKVNNSVDSAFLMPFCQAILPGSKGRIETRVLPRQFFMGLTDYSFRFSKNRLIDITDILQRAYVVEISITNRQVIDWQYSGTFNQVSLYKILDRLSFSKPFKYRTDGNRIIIY